MTAPSADLGPLLARVPDVLRGASAYHVPVPSVLVAKLDANELPYPLPAELRARLGAVLAGVALERYPDPTAKRLRAAVVALHAAHRITGEQLVFGNGSDELIAMLCSAFAGASPTVPAPVLYPVPSFVYYKIAAVSRGLPTVEVPLGPRFVLDEAAITRAVAEHQPSVVFLALPNNPTGGLWRMDFAVELAAAYPNVVVVSDEAYAAYSGATNLAHGAAHPNLVVMRTLSKIGLAGLRVGYAICAPAVAHLLEKVRPPYNLSALDQAAAAFLIGEASPWCAARAAEVVAERGRLHAELTARGYDVIDSAANLLLVRFADAAGTWRRLHEAGISVRAFGGGPLASYLRITIGTPAETDSLLVHLAGDRGPQAGI